MSEINEFGPIRSIAELKNCRFFIPDYQRGYRWNSSEVEALLNDISTFSPEVISGSNEKSWYCLQPLVVKKREDASYEVIDGQQRLTTIFLISRYINIEWRGRQKDPEFSLDYKSRTQTGTFLAQLGETIEIDSSNIDYFYISKAYKTIHDWVESQTNLNRDNFISVFRHHVKLIWYDAKDSDSIDSFTRLNMGKIPLTNAELIKALFLNSSNYGRNENAAYNEEKIRLKQLEISREWDRMETAFNDEAFWCFLVDQEKQRQTRIDLIFEIITGTINISESDPYAMFRKYSEFFKDFTEDEIELQWQEVIRCFQILEEWYKNRITFHKIGYLITFGSKDKLMKLFREAKIKTKSDFMSFLDREISQTLPESLDDLKYGDGKIRPVLLLHNIQTMLNNKEENSRFSFDRYKKDNWDVEHIFSQNEKVPEKPKHRREWLNDVKPYILCEKVKNELSKILETNLESENEFKSVYNSVLADFARGEKEEEINALSNLALLDSKTNRGYGNAAFPVKRATIIQKERKGTFVPVCTKNVFMKFYSEQVKYFTFWSSHDQEEYFADISNVLGEYKSGYKSEKTEENPS